MDTLGKENTLVYGADAPGPILNQILVVPKKQNILLRKGLTDAWGEADRVQEFTTHVNTTQGQLAARDNGIAALKDENANLRSIIQQQSGELAYHENCNNSARCRLYAGRRRQFHDDVAGAQGVMDVSEAGGRVTRGWSRCDHSGSRGRCG